MTIKPASLGPGYAERLGLMCRAFPHILDGKLKSIQFTEHPKLIVSENLNSDLRTETIRLTSENDEELGIYVLELGTTQKGITLQKTSGHCNGCAAQGDFKKCSGCRHARYCSSECQSRNWKTHKPACKAIGEFKEVFREKLL